MESFGSIMHKKGFKNLPATQGWHDLSNQHLTPPCSRPTITTCSSGISWPPAASRTTALKKSGLLWGAKIHLPRGCLPKWLQKMYTRCSPPKNTWKEKPQIARNQTCRLESRNTLCMQTKMLIYKYVRYLMSMFICSITRVYIDRSRMIYATKKSTKQPRTWSGNLENKNPETHCFNIHIHPWVVPGPFFQPAMLVY